MKMQTKLSQQIQQSFVAAFVLAVALPMPQAAFALGLADIATNLITGQLYVIPDFVSAICYIAGVVFISAGVFKLKDHADNPGSNKLTPAVSRLAAGAALVAMPSLASMVLTTLSLTSNASDGRTFHGFGVTTN